MKRNVLTQYLIITASCALYAVGFNWMFDPNHISVGGFTGLGQIINYLLPGLPIGTIVIILNVPLFVLGWRFIGKDFLFSSVYATAVSSLMIDGLAAVHTFKPMEPILACLYGGVIIGVSCGIMLREGATTGGTELAARLLKLKLESLSIGTLCLAIDILAFLTGISSRDGEKFPVLRKAVRTVSQNQNHGLLQVIEELRKEDTAVSRNIADHIESFTDYDFAQLLFSDGSVENAISLDNQLNIIQVADLVLPDKDTTFEEYTTIELLSVSILIVISTFALDFIHSDRSIFKIVDLDEAWAFLNVAQGETLSNKLVRAGRAMNAGVYFVTQSSGDVSKESLKNNIGLKFAFRSTDTNEIKQTLEFFGLDSEDENNQKRLRDLENGQCLMQDLYGRVGVVQIHPVFVELLHAFDTRPPIKSEVDLE